MKRIALLMTAVVMACSVMAENSKKITVSPSNPRMYSRFIYNYRSVLQDFEIDPDISGFVSPTGVKAFPAFIIKGNDGLFYAVSAADIVAFADKIEVTITDSASKVSYADLTVAGVSEKLNLAITPLPKEANVSSALEIDSVWFTDQSEQYTLQARMFMKSVPTTITGDASTLGVLYERMANSAAEGYKYLLPNLSYKYLYSKTADEIADGIDSLSEADYKQFRTLNANGDLITAMRMLAGDMAAKRMKMGTEFTSQTVKDNSVVLEGKNGEMVTFTKELGAWRMISDAKHNPASTSTTATYVANANQYREATAAPNSIEQDVIGTMITGKVMIPYSFCDQGVSGSVDIGYAFKFLTFEAVFEYNALGLYKTPTYDPYYYGGQPYNHDYRYSSFFGIGIRLGGFVPIVLNEKLTVAPTIKFEWETPFPTRYANYYINTISPIVGANLFVRIKNSPARFLLGLQYEQKFFFDYYNSLRLKNNTMGYFNINFGFLF